MKNSRKKLSAVNKLKTIHTVEYDYSNHIDGLVVYKSEYIDSGTGFPSLDVTYLIITNQNLEKIITDKLIGIDAENLYALLMKKQMLVDKTGKLEISSVAQMDFPFNVIINEKDCSSDFFMCDDDVKKLANQLFSKEPADNINVEKYAQQIKEEIEDVVGAPYDEHNIQMP